MAEVEMTAEQLVQTPLDPKYVDAADLEQQSKPVENPVMEKTVTENPPVETKPEETKVEESVKDLNLTAITDADLEKLIDVAPELAEKIMSAKDALGEPVTSPAPEPAKVIDVKPAPQEVVPEVIQEQLNDMAYRQQVFFNQQVNDWRTNQAQIENQLASINVKVAEARESLTDLEQDSKAYSFLTENISTLTKQADQLRQNQKNLSDSILVVTAIKDELERIPEFKPYMTDYIQARLNGEITSNDSIQSVRQKMQTYLGRLGVKIVTAPKVRIQDTSKAELRAAALKKLEAHRAKRNGTGGTAKPVTKTASDKAAEIENRLTPAQRDALKYF